MGPGILTGNRFFYARHHAICHSRRSQKKILAMAHHPAPTRPIRSRFLALSATATRTVIAMPVPRKNRKGGPRRALSGPRRQMRSWTRRFRRERRRAAPAAVVMTSPPPPRANVEQRDAIAATRRGRSPAAAPPRPRLRHRLTHYKLAYPYLALFIPAFC